jgi:hypothetical protein
MLHGTATTDKWPSCQKKYNVAEKYNSATFYNYTATGNVATARSII